MSPLDKSFNHSYAIWSLYKYDENSPAHRDVRVWRVKAYLGIHKSEEIAPALTERWGQVARHVPRAGLLVIDDADQAFRKLADVWRQGLTFGPRRVKPWVILKMAHPVAHGALWRPRPGRETRRPA